jgi:hypothetical protein
VAIPIDFQPETNADTSSDSLDFQPIPASPTQSYQFTPPSPPPIVNAQPDANAVRKLVVQPHQWTQAEADKLQPPPETEGVGVRLLKAVPADIAAGLPNPFDRGKVGGAQFSGNIPAAFQPTEANYPYAPKPLPIDQIESQEAKEAPIATTIAKVSQGIAQAAPMAVVGGLPPAIAKLIFARFTADMIKNIPSTAKALGDEMGKNPDDRDYGKITDLVSDGIQQLLFGTLGAKHFYDLGADAIAAKMVDKYVPRGAGIDSGRFPISIPLDYKQPTTGIPNATRLQPQQEVIQPERVGGNAGGETAGPGARDSVLNQTPGEETPGTPREETIESPAAEAPRIKLPPEQDVMPVAGMNVGDTISVKGFISKVVDKDAQNLYVEHEGGVKQTVPLTMRLQFDKGTYKPATAPEVTPPIAPENVEPLRQKLLTNMQGRHMEITPSDFQTADAHLKLVLGKDAPSWDALTKAGVIQAAPTDKGMIAVMVKQPEPVAVPPVAPPVIAQPPVVSIKTPAIRFKNRIYEGQTGETHNDIIARVKAQKGIPKVKNVSVTRGFVTSEGKFVSDRAQAAKIATAAGQVPDTVTELHSEDFWKAKGVPLKTPTAASGDEADVPKSEHRAGGGTENVARGIRARKVFDSETTMNGQDILSWMVDSGVKMMSKSDARKSLGQEGWKRVADLYDDAAPLSRPHHNVIYKGRLLPDKVAQAAFDAGVLTSPDVPVLWDTIKKASSQRANAFKEGRSHEAMLKNEIQQHNDWMKATKEGEIRVKANDLKVGESLEVEGQKLKVTAIDPDTGEVTVEDGSKFGIQRLESGQSIFVENILGGEDEGGDFLPEDEVVPAKKPGETFTLGAPETVDQQNARLDAERKMAAAKQAELDQAEAARQQQAKRLGGDLGTAGQGGLFPEPGQQEIFRPASPKPTAPPAPAVVPKPAVPVEEPMWQTAGYRTEKVFRNDFQKNRLAEYNENEDEFVRRRFCSGTVPKGSKGAQAYIKIRAE